jgi:hypothetical protein
MHLRGARKLLESLGGLEVCQHNSRTRAQIAILIWSVQRTRLRSTLTLGQVGYNACLPVETGTDHVTTIFRRARAVRRH